MGDFDVMDPRYRSLFDRVCAVLGADPRVESVSAAGSVARGTADRWSDLDVLVLVEDRAVGEFLDDWKSWLAAITPTVFARRPIAPFIINSLTSDGLTLDIAVYPAGQGPPPPAPRGFAVGLLSRQSFSDHRDALPYATEELLRCLAGPFIGYLKRNAHALHLAGVAHVMSLLIEVLLAENDVPEPPGKHLDAVLTDEQRTMLASLPPVAPTYDRLLDFGLAVAREIIIRARPLYRTFDLPWPAELTAVAARRIHEHLDVDASTWLH